MCLRYISGRYSWGLCWSSHSGNLSAFYSHPQGVFGAPTWEVSMWALGAYSGVNFTREIWRAVCSGILVILWK